MGVHRNTVRRWIQDGDIPAVIVGRNRYFMDTKDVHALKIGREYAPRKNN